MIIEKLVDMSKKYYCEPSMLLSVSPASYKNPDDKILEQFGKVCELNPLVGCIVIAGTPDPMDRCDDLRSFIFSARKKYTPYLRPLIVICTDYFDDELWNCYSGINSELLSYGNALLRTGRATQTDKALYFNEFLGIHLKGKMQTVKSYAGMEYM